MSPPRAWRRYPWEEWIDGNVHVVQLSPGHAVASFGALLRGKAAKAKRMVRVKSGAPLPPGQVRFQFHDTHWWDVNTEPEPDGWVCR